MLNKSEQQTIQDVNGSTINQAGGDVVVNNYGMSPVEAMGLVKQLVSYEMSQYLQQAQVTAQDRLAEFSQKFEERIDAKLHEHLSRFNEPSMQLAARDAALGYIRNGNPVEGDALVDMLIERVQVEEHTTQQQLIDKAIRILPTLSNECLALITFIAYVNIQKSCNYHTYKKWLECMNPVIDALVKVNSLDIAFLHQAECATGLTGFSYSSNFIDSQLKHSDLFFRHPASNAFTSYAMEKYGIEFIENGMTFSRANQKQMLDFVSTFMINDSKSFYSMITSSVHLKQLISNKRLDSIAEDLDKFIEESVPFTQDEVIAYFNNINSNWTSVLELLKRQDLQSMRLTPVGNYIACRQLSRLSGDKLDMEIFYR